MLVQPQPPVDFQFSTKSSPNPSLFQNLQQSSPVKRRNIILQPPPELSNSYAKPIMNLSALANNLLQFREQAEILAMRHRSSATMLTEATSVTKESESEPVSELSSPEMRNVNVSGRSKKIGKNKENDEEKKKGKRIYEISRFFVKNYIGALKSTIHNVVCANDIMDYLSCTREHIEEIKQELDKLLKENPKHNRMQLYKLITNPTLNPIFQYFLRRKVVSWIFTSSKMQDRQAHLMARKNFLFLCLKAKELTPYNFKIALNFK